MNVSAMNKQTVPAMPFSTYLDKATLIDFMCEIIEKTFPVSKVAQEPTSVDEISALCFLLRAKLERERAQPEASIVKPVPLTKRQCQCMYWVANGKSSWDISQILKISEDTVNYHIKRVLTRLAPMRQGITAMMIPTPTILCIPFSTG